MYHGLLGEASLKLCQTSEADPVAVLATLLAGYGVMVGPSPFVRIGADSHPPLIWPLILGHTSIGRKGTSWGVARSILRPSDPAFWSEGLTTGLSSGEGLIAAVADEDPDDPANKGRLIVPGGKARLVVETEYSVTMRRSAREGNSLGGVVRQAWDGDDLAVMTKAKLRATAPRISILAHITPGEFRACVKNSEMAGGTYNRFLPIYSERTKVIPEGEGADEQLINSLGDRMATNLMKARDAGKVGLTPDAREFWTEVAYPALSESPPADGPVAQFTARATPYARRLAMVYALADAKAIVDVAHLTAAYHLVNYSRATAAFVLGGASGTGDPQLDKALAALIEAGPSGLTRSQISAVFSRKLTRSALDDLLGKLEALAEVERREQASAGRTATVWAVAAKKAKEAKEGP
ncbi:DUF3987 domain-containing protein [Catenulispora sp. GP43]|uniref:DUF3987 domain-containing protein n=1 Tax=Catenulispora sp. GP43 TaxID=3156263 RepID=UPI0035134B8D